MTDIPILDFYKLLLDAPRFCLKPNKSNSTLILTGLRFFHNNTTETGFLNLYSRLFSFFHELICCTPIVTGYYC